MEASTTEPGQIAGFWRRIFAAFLDSITLGIIGLILGFFLSTYFERLGVWGRAIGLMIALVYLGTMNSRIRNGQTIGKMATKIKVVTGDGRPLSVKASFCRSGILCIPFFLNGAAFNAELLQSWFLWIVSILVFGVGVSIAYLFIFNRRTRQSLHDLAVGSYVVSARSEAVPTPVSSPWRWHFAVVGVLLLLAAAAPFLTGQFARREPFVSLLALQKNLEKEPDVQYVTLQVGRNSYASTQQGSQSSTFLFTRVVTTVSAENQEALANKVAAMELAAYKESSQLNVISVQMNTGYDIGISSMWQSKNFSFSPDGWKQRLAQNPDTSFQDGQTTLHP